MGKVMQMLLYNYCHKASPYMFSTGMLIFTTDVILVAIYNYGIKKILGTL